ncbi:hypothetical protein CHELA20_54514 [Hyphomicrobiales bacterium]|nr:hypothetical protein CHELA41_20412 [Hyphomicrobiales bacterium]CAH1686416.1 hypothetical protein CHELA20_54514 [Hyphomicrobiales bacterium]
MRLNSNWLPWRPVLYGFLNKTRMRGGLMHATRVSQIGVLLLLAGLLTLARQHKSLRFWRT